jgi:hypothetical protein
MIRKTLLTLGLLGLLAASALAVNNNFTFHNRTGSAVIGIWVSPHYSGNWGSNLIDGAVDYNEYQRIDVDDEEHTDFDFKVEYDNGVTNENKDGYDLSRYGNVYISPSNHFHSTYWDFER